MWAESRVQRVERVYSMVRERRKGTGEETILQPKEKRVSRTTGCSVPMKSRDVIWPQYRVQS